ncbi:MAG: LysR family transcriptional regulator [Bdellovibrionota bacterium]
MTFDQVLVFHRIVESGSFKAAAAELHKTQPAISFSIKKLEEEMEAPLFDRTSYRPTLTAHGKMFYEKSLRVLQGMSELEGLTNSFQKKEEPEITLSVDGISPLPKLLTTFRDFGERYPNTKLNLTFDILSETERKVLSRESLFGITHFLSDNSQLEIVPITKVKMIPVMNRELFMSRKIKKQDDLRDISQIIVSDRNKNGASFGLLNEGKKWRLNDANFKREIILAGLGWGHLPEHSIERELKDKKLMIIDFPETHPRDLNINLIRLKRINLGIVAKSLWSELTALHD